VRKDAERGYLATLLLGCERRRVTEPRSNKCLSAPAAGELIVLILGHEHRQASSSGPVNSSGSSFGAAATGVVATQLLGRGYRPGRLGR
jgi:hypothetical protein